MGAGSWREGGVRGEAGEQQNELRLSRQGAVPQLTAFKG